MGRTAALAFVFAMVASTAVLAGASPAGACSCAPDRPTEAAALEGADAVFIGSVEQIYDARAGSSANPEVVVLQVSDVFKGDVTQSQGIVTPADEASCGYGFVVGEVYVVFSSRTVGTDEGFYESTLCDGTRLLDDQLPEFGITPTLPIEGGQTVAQIQDQLGATRTSLLPEMLILAGVLAFVLGLAGWFSRKNRPAI